MVSSKIPVKISNLKRTRTTYTGRIKQNLLFYDSQFTVFPSPRLHVQIIMKMAQMINEIDHYSLVKSGFRFSKKADIPCDQSRT
jgi:hypothetical protein